MVGGKLLFAADDGQAGRQLWATDGTKAGTELLKAVNAGTRGSDPSQFVSAGGKAFFVADSGSGAAVYATDGSAAPTLLRQFGQVYEGTGTPPPFGTLRDLPESLTPVGDKLYFVVRAGTYGRQLWVTDGSKAGTTQLRDLPSDVNGWSYSYRPSGFDNLTAADGKLYFTVDAKGAGQTLWATDGTAAGTKRVTILTTYGGLYDRPPYERTLVTAGGVLVLKVQEDAATQSVWASDGTAAGTGRLSTVVNPDPNAPYGPPVGVEQLTPAGDRVYFVRPDGDTGRQVWVTDGTTAGTKRVKAIGTVGETGPIWPGGPSFKLDGSPQLLRAVGGSVVFAVTAPDVGRELWVTDGTAVGTRLVRGDGNPGKADGVNLYGPIGATATSSRLVFAAISSQAGSEPWSVPLADLGIATSPPPATVPPTTPPVVPPVVVPPTVPPAAPKATLVSAPTLSATEGTKATFILATVTLPAGPTYRVTVFWGDGRTAAGTLTATAAGGRTFRVTADHTYANPGTQNVLIRVTADGKTVLSIDSTAAVADARFYAGRVAQRVGVTQAFNGVVATIQDTNPAGGRASDFAATIDWGNGQTTAGTVRRTAAGKFEVVGANVFTTAGQKKVTVTIRSVASGRVAAAESIFTIDPPRAGRTGR